MSRRIKKCNFITQQICEILQFKEFCILIGQSGGFRTVTKEPDFHRHVAFAESLKTIITFIFTLQSTYEWIRFMSKLKKPHFGATFGTFWALTSPNFFSNTTLRHFSYSMTNFMRKIRKTNEPISILCVTNERTYGRMLCYVYFISGSTIK